MRSGPVGLLLATLALCVVTTAAQDLSAVPAAVRPDVQAAANAINAQKSMDAGLQSNTPLSTSGTSGVSSDGTTTTITPPVSSKKTFQQVNQQAPNFRATNGATFRPKASSQGATAVPYAASGGDQDQITGDPISQVVGVRIATPIFGTGFNFCIDRYFGSFPKVGIVIPNAVAWLAPEVQDVVKSLQTILNLPTNLPHGFRINPTADGFLIQLPTIQPSQLSNFGFRYGIQIGQALGFDFGYGIIKDTCFIDFVIV